MPRAEVGTPKFVANKMKSKGLQRLRWYCKFNGFKCHAASESHLRQMLVVGEHAGSHIAGFSQQFQSEFVSCFQEGPFGTKRVRANQVYQEYIADKNHLHMNSTRWVPCRSSVDETEKGWFIAWIDSSPKALEKAEAAQKKDRAAISDEQRERQLMRSKLSEQQRRPAMKQGPAVNPLKANPLKRPNVFKSAPSAASSEGGDKAGNEKKRPAPMTAAEKLIIEEQERKRRRMDRDNMA
ncbi:domain of Kin17 curved DNA-binding protein-domain-containing protein [Flammula alnicola]|nr:domain of Kin17 curved DNA-binding protein-domain-containing protein [Flammula alnicola]